MVSPQDINLSEVIFEFQRVGKMTRVVAIDPVSNTEITMVGAPGYGQEALKTLAMRKLKYVIAKNLNAKS